ncbi:hypothetical protein QJS66_19275 [Kocuria rhizophila]|nr:hypothetical protein QJS66_19275 [Kocuria rhizophila]
MTLQTFPIALQDPGGGRLVRRSALCGDSRQGPASRSPATRPARSERSCCTSTTPPRPRSDSPQWTRTASWNRATTDALVRVWPPRRTTATGSATFAFTATPRPRPSKFSAPPTRRARGAVRPLLHEAGHPGGLHPGRAEELHHLRRASPRSAAGFRTPQSVPGGNGTTAGRAAAASSSGESAESGEWTCAGARARTSDLWSCTPTNVTSKVEHDRQHYLTTVQPALNGRGKAMVVASARGRGAVPARIPAPASSAEPATEDPGGVLRHTADRTWR